MVRDAQAARAALSGVKDEARNTEASLRGTSDGLRLTGKSLNDALQASGGVVQIGTGLKGVADALTQVGRGASNLDALSRAGFGASRVLLEIVQTGTQFRLLGASIGGVSGAMGTLAAVVRAHPMLVVATAISAAASAMALFASSTKDASDAAQSLSEQMVKIRATSDIGALFGEENLSKQAKSSELQLLLDTAVNLRATNQNLQFGDATSVLNLSREDIFGMLGVGGPVGRTNDIEERLRFNRQQGLVDRGIPADQAIELIRNRARTLQVPPDYYGSALRRYQEGSPQPDLSAAGYPGSTREQYGPTGIEALMQEDDMRLAEQRLLELEATGVRVGESIGASFGNAFTAFVSGAATAQEALGAFYMQIINMVSSSAFAKLFGLIGGSVAGGLGGGGVGDGFRLAPGQQGPPVSAGFNN